MEAYGHIVFMLSFAGIFISIISGITYALCKKTLQYAWIFGCIAGFCFFTALRHIIVLLGYADITNPTYEAYKDWNVYRFILSDIIRLFIWLGIGVLNYIAFIKRNKLLKYLFIVVASIFLILIVVLVGLSSVTFMSMRWTIPVYRATPLSGQLDLKCVPLPTVLSRSYL